MSFFILRVVNIEEGSREKQRQRSSRLFGAQILFNSLPRKLFCFGRFGRIVWIQPFLPNFQLWKVILLAVVHNIYTVDIYYIYTSVVYTSDLSGGGGPIPTAYRGFAPILPLILFNKGSTNIKVIHGRPIAVLIYRGEGFPRVLFRNKQTNIILTVLYTQYSTVQ